MNHTPGTLLTTLCESPRVIESVLVPYLPLLPCVGLRIIVGLVQYDLEITLRSNFNYDVLKHM